MDTASGEAVPAKQKQAPLSTRRPGGLFGEEGRF